MRRRFTQEQIDTANRKDILSVARDLGMDLVERRGTYKAPGMGGLYITPSKNSFNCFSSGYQGEKNHGGGPIQLVMFYNKCSFVEAVYYLLGVSAEQISIKRTKAKKKRDIVIPEKAANYSHVYAYLTKNRKIARWVIDILIKEKLLYENNYHSCVFVGYDFEGNIKHCAIHGTVDENAFKGEAENSDKKYAFHRSGITDTLHVFEAPIDGMSYLTFYPEAKKDHLLALCCLADVNLQEYLKHNKISSIIFHLDNDKWGNKQTETLLEVYGENYFVSDERPEKKYKDWNEMLKAERL